MSITFPDEEMINRFKQRINYPTIVQHITDEKRVLMDWPEALKKINVSDTSAWVSYNLDGGILRKNHATISDFFENGKKKITIEVHVFTNVPNQYVIEEAVLLTGYTSMLDVQDEYLKDGPGDFYLFYEYWNEMTGDNTSISVFKNIILEINSTEDDVDVRPVAKLLVDLMSNALVDKAKVPEIKYNMQQSAQEVKAGDTFWVDIQFPSGNYPDDYDIDLQTDPLPEGLEYVKNDESKYYIKASQSGTYQFEMWVMDIRTLITSTATFTVVVKN